MEHLPQFIYLDSKIVGTAKQIATFFEEGIFASETTVLIKKYKHKSAKQIAAIFRLHGIAYRFVLAQDLDTLPKGVMFYPFNAQSNCRAVANRHLTHIFITHGESNKAASVKPIIRIYDYVLTAGQAGIDRFLAHGIFSQHDVDSGRLITAGDTFIGKTGLSKQGKKCIFYAPTWEGGIEQENYSSLAYWQQVAERIIQKVAEYQVDTLVIRSHPNTGHRLAYYQENLFQLAKTCMQHNLKVIAYQPNLALSLFQQWKWKKLGIKFSSNLKDFQAVFALCDVSAIETQLLNEDISYELFYPAYQSTMAIPNLNVYHEVAPMDIQAAWLSLHDAAQHKIYWINTHFEQMALSNRITFLINQLSQYERN